MRELPEELTGTSKHEQEEEKRLYGMETPGTGRPEKPGNSWIERLKGVKRSKEDLEKDGVLVGEKRIRRRKLDKQTGEERTEFVRAGRVYSVTVSEYSLESGKAKQFRRETGDGRLLRRIELKPGNYAAVEDFDPEIGPDKPTSVTRLVDGRPYELTDNSYFPVVMNVETGSIRKPDDDEPIMDGERLEYLLGQDVVRSYNKEGLARTTRVEREYDTKTGRLKKTEEVQLDYKEPGNPYSPAERKETDLTYEYKGDSETALFETRRGEERHYDSKHAEEPVRQFEVLEHYANSRLVLSRRQEFTFAQVALPEDEQKKFQKDAEALKRERERGRDIRYVRYERGKGEYVEYEKQKGTLTEQHYAYDDAGRQTERLLTVNGHMSGWRGMEYDRYSRPVSREQLRDGETAAVITYEYEHKRPIRTVTPETADQYSLHADRITVKDLEAREVRHYRKTKPGEEPDERAPEFGFVLESTEKLEEGNASV